MHYQLIKARCQFFMNLFCLQNESTILSSKFILEKLKFHAEYRWQVKKISKFMESNHIFITYIRMYIFII